MIKLRWRVVRYAGQIVLGEGVIGRALVGRTDVPPAPSSLRSSAGGRPWPGRISGPTVRVGGRRAGAPGRVPGSHSADQILILVTTHNPAEGVDDKARNDRP